MPQFTPKDLIRYFCREIKGVDPEPLGENAFLFLSPGDLKRAKKTLGGEDLQTWSWKAHGVCKADSICLLSTYIGAPNLAMSLEEFASFGVKRIIIIGYGGGIGEDMDVGSILIPEWSIINEGVSPCYGKKWGEKVFSSKELSAKILKVLKKSSLKDRVKVGGMFSTSAPYRETRELLDKMIEMGCKAVDMEFSAAFTIASLRGLDVAGVVIITDKVYPGGWKPGFFSDIFKESRRGVFSLLKEILEVSFAA